MIVQECIFIFSLKLGVGDFPLQNRVLPNQKLITFLIRLDDKIK